MSSSICDALQGFYDNPESIAGSDLSSVQILNHLSEHAPVCERCSKFFEGCDIVRFTDMNLAIMENIERTPVEDFPDEELRTAKPVRFSELVEASKPSEDE